jgi:hypothetical protein
VCCGVSDKVGFPSGESAELMVVSGAGRCEGCSGVAGGMLGKQDVVFDGGSVDRASWVADGSGGALECSLCGSAVSVLNRQLQVLCAVALVCCITGGVTQCGAESITLVDGEGPFD